MTMELKKIGIGTMVNDNLDDSNDVNFTTFRMRKNLSNIIIGISILTTLLCACSQKQGGDIKEASMDIGSTKTCVMSDDSLITVYWWDTGDGGTAPQIDAVCRFKTDGGQEKEITTPLLSLVHPGDDYGHHEVEKIISLDTEYGQRVYFFYLRAKVGSNEYAHDIVSMTIENDSLLPINVISTENGCSSHISLDLGRLNDNSAPLGKSQSA